MGSCTTGIALWTPTTAKRSVDASNPPDTAWSRRSGARIWISGTGRSSPIRSAGTIPYRASGSPSWMRMACWRIWQPSTTTRTKWSTGTISSRSRPSFRWACIWQMLWSGRAWMPASCWRRSRAPRVSRLGLRMSCGNSPTHCRPQGWGRTTLRQSRPRQRSIASRDGTTPSGKRRGRTSARSECDSPGVTTSPTPVPASCRKCYSVPSGLPWNRTSARHRTERPRPQHG